MMHNIRFEKRISFRTNRLHQVRKDNAYAQVR